MQSFLHGFCKDGALKFSDSMKFNNNLMFCGKNVEKLVILNNDV